MRRPISALTVFLATSTLLSAAPLSKPQPDLASLLDGVRQVGAPGVPGNVVVFGEQAFCVVAGTKGGASVPVVGAARYGKGRVVAFGHDGYFGSDMVRVGDTGRLLVNSARWTARNGPQKPRVGLSKRVQLKDYLEGQGLKTTTVDSRSMIGIDVLVADARDVSDKEIEPYAKFVRDGGGLVIAATGWGWVVTHDGKDLRQEFPANHLLAPMGMVWGDGTVEKTGSEGFSTKEPLPPVLHAGIALSRAMEQISGRSKLDSSELGQISATLTSAARSIPANDALFFPKLATIGNQTQQVIPMPKTPVTKENIGARLAITLKSITAKALPPEQVRADAASRVFPGEVPTVAPRTARMVTIDTHRPDWHSTGLYAAPGEVVTVAIPDTAANKNLGLRIGAHTDQLWQLDKWQRSPEISIRVRLDKPVVRAASAFGGLIYIDVPSKCSLGSIQVKISGAVASPYFVAGQTKLTDWKSLIRKEPAPWAELECSRIIVTVPSAVVRTLDDPEALMKVWDRVVELEDELAGTTAERKRPERVVCDQQISAGYMHSGYPIMTWMDQPKNFVSRESLLKGNWGIFHELGHNHQSKDWTFEGTGEVTCNIFSIYIFDKICGVKPADGRVNLKEVAKHFAECRASGKPDYEKWKSSPFMALSVYVQLQDAFGWDVFKKVFAEYRDLKPSERPKTDEQKRDQWMVRFSKAAGRNVAPLFATWGIPVSVSAVQEVANLPEWKGK